MGCVGAERRGRAPDKHPLVLVVGVGLFDWFVEVQVDEECTGRICQAGDGDGGFEGRFSNLQGRGISGQLVTW